MTNITWKTVESPSNNPQCQPPACTQNQASNDPWFGIAMGLIGVIVGFVLRSFILPS